MVAGRLMCRPSLICAILTTLLLPLSDSSAQGGGPSSLCHATDGTFTVCPDGSQEWSDVPFEFFPESGSFLYADQADLDPLLGTASSPLDTFMLMYDECNRTEPLEPDEYFLVHFTTVEVEDGAEKLEHYVIHIFTDGTIIFIEDGVPEADESGEIRVTEIEGQRGAVGFGPSPNCAFDHVVVEFEIGLSDAQFLLDGAYSPDPQFWGAPRRCSVTITGGAATMNFGQRAELSATVSGGTPASFQWMVDPAILKDYTETTNVPWSTTPMAAADFQTQSIDFYWKPPGGARAVSVEVTLTDGTVCDTTRNINVERDTADITKQAEDYYTSNHTGRVLTEHNSWHANFRFSDASAGQDLFFFFHRQFIDRFNSWRAEFGYPSVTAWDPATPLPTGVAIDHTPRPGTTTAAAHAKPSWFTIPGAAAGRPSNTFPCDTGAGQTKLADFAADQKLLGCATESPWHNSIHVALRGDMLSTTNAPKDPIFWRWHEFADSVSSDRNTLTPPIVVYQSPFRLFRFITDISSVGVTFSQSVTGVVAGDLSVNGSPATSVTGSDEGPYVFTGHALPPPGPVTVSIGSGSVQNLGGEAFGGTSWTQQLIDPTLDSDADGVNDGEEVTVHMTDPTSSDTDGDGLPDAFEIENSCLNPLEDQANPNDAHGVPAVGDDDADDDGLSDIEEFLGGTDPCSRTFVPGQNAIRVGFDSSTLARNDDGSTGSVPLGFSMNFFGEAFAQAFVNNNGNLTLDFPLSIFTPFDLTSTGRVIIAPFFADVDTRSAGDPVRYGPGTVDGHQAFGASWIDVDCFNSSTGRTVRNFFQLVLIDRSDVGAGDIDIEFNYDSIQWETGQASGGSFDCLGGTSARAGFSNGTGEPGTFFELPGSAVQGAFLDSNLETGLIHGQLNTEQLGRYVFPVRVGMPVTEEDGDDDGVPDELDNCPGTPNTDQEDSDFNGTGDACQIPDLQNSTASFLQALDDGSTSIEPTPLAVEEEPELAEKIARIVQFRVDSGLAASEEEVLANLVGSVVDAGLVAPEDADMLSDLVRLQLDEDGDGVPNDLDQCPASDLSATVVIDSCDSGVDNVLFEDGCTIADRIAACTVGARNHGAFVSCVAHSANILKRTEIISGKEKGRIQSCAARADVPNG